VAGEYKRSIYLRLTNDDAAGGMVADTAMQGVIKGSSASRKEKHLDPEQLWNVYQELNKREEKVKMSGTVGLKDSHNAHYLVPKGQAVRQCDLCHTANAQFFTTISLAVKGNDGRELLYQVDEAALGSLFVMLPLNQFYAVGSMRQQAFDIMGAIMIMGGLAVPVLHGTIRLLTARVRRARQHSGPGRGTRP